MAKSNSWESQALREFKRYGWKVAHFRPAWINGRMLTPVGAQGKGFPDVVAVRERLIVAELKSGKDDLRPEQMDWLTALFAARVEVYIWRPEDYELMVEVLQRWAPTPPWSVTHADREAARARAKAKAKPGERRIDLEINR